LRPDDTLKRSITRIEAAHSGLVRAEATAAAVSDLATAPPTLRDVSHLVAMDKRMTDVNRSLAEAEKQARAAQEQALGAADEMDKALKALGNVCPTCGSQVDHEHLMRAEAAR
jgi:DNA repair exonuclease SbcCD ATPase subunit